MTEKWQYKQITQLVQGSGLYAHINDNDGTGGTWAEATQIIDTTTDDLDDNYRLVYRLDIHDESQDEHSYTDYNTLAEILTAMIDLAPPEKWA